MSPVRSAVLRMPKLFTQMGESIASPVTITKEQATPL